MSDTDLNDSLFGDDALWAPPWRALTPAEESTPGEERFRQVLSEADYGTDSVARPRRLGRFELIEHIGEGGMGTVYRAFDPVSSQTVAIKVLHHDLAARSEAVRRFTKEARLLSEVRSEHVTQLLEVSEDRGTHFLVMEFVDGQSLAALLTEYGRLDEPLALAIAARVAGALADLHPLGIIHRDIKPANILIRFADLLKQSPDSSTLQGELLEVKVTDFGLARHVSQAQSLAMTHAASLLGTPLYMAPEQFTGDENVDARADLYALGATLFEMLSGQPPFAADHAMKLADMHRHVAPPRLRSVRSDVSDGVSEIIAKSLEKRPDDRYSEAPHMLADIERLLRGEATRIVPHPLIPACDRKNLLRFHYTWQTASSPARLWPFVSNTERLNRAIGLPAVDFFSDVGDHGEVRRFASIKVAGIRMRWREHVFEWIEERRFGVLREFATGPLKWFTSVVELHPRVGGGATLTHTFEIEPRGILCRFLARLKFGRNAKRSLGDVYRRIDSVLDLTPDSDSLIDHFEQPLQPSRIPLSPSWQQHRRLELIILRMSRAIGNSAALLKIADFVKTAPPQEAGRIRPLALARRLNLPEEQVIAIGLHGVREGLFVLLWDIVCPVCRISTQTCDTIRTLQDHVHCEACNFDFDIDLARSVELIFRTHPQVRTAETGQFCIGGPAHSPHVVLQMRIAPDETADLGVSLRAGTYKLRGPQLPYSMLISVRAGVFPQRLELNLSKPSHWVPETTLRTGSQVIRITNAFSHEVTVRIERTAMTDDSLTAIKALSIPLFRELFPEELLSSRQLVTITRITLLVTSAGATDELTGCVDSARVQRLLHEHLQRLSEVMRETGGVWIKIVGDGAMIAFSDADMAFSAARKLAPTLPLRDGLSAFQLRAVIHSGEAILSSINGQLDYPGTTALTAVKLLEVANPGEVLVTHPAACDTELLGLGLLRTSTLDPETVTIAGIRTGFYRLPATADALR